MYRKDSIGNYMSHRELISNTHKQFIQLNSKKIKKNYNAIAKYSFLTIYQ